MSEIRSNSTNPASIAIIPADVELLNRCFSTKTMFDISLGCDDEARQILQASLSDSAIRHAVTSLRALREDLETYGDDPTSSAQQNPSYHYGVQQYSMALGGLASNLSTPSSSVLKSALLCCQIFISIEQVRKNYGAMAQHIVRGLNIMHEYRARPGIAAMRELVPAHHDQLPLLDVFIIKLFAAPCKFADRPTTIDMSQTTTSNCPLSSAQGFSKPLSARAIVPDSRTELTKIAASTLRFLDRVSQVESVEMALRLLPEKECLLVSLESWLSSLEVFQAEIRPGDPEPISISFLRLFYSILKVVLSGALESLADVQSERQTANSQLQDIAGKLTESVKGYVRCTGNNSGRGEHSKMQ